MKERLQVLVIALPAMVSMAVTGRLAVSFVWAILGIGSPLPSPAAHAQTRPAIELERAIARKIEAAGRRFDTGDTDGRQVVYSRRSTEDELIHGDLAGTHQSTIFKAKKGAISFSVSFRHSCARTG